MVGLRSNLLLRITLGLTVGPPVIAALAVDMLGVADDSVAGVFFDIRLASIWTLIWVGVLCALHEGIGTEGWERCDISIVDPLGSGGWLAMLPPLIFLVPGLMAIRAGRRIPVAFIVTGLIQYGVFFCVARLRRRAEGSTGEE